jgi:hypothetical protein
MIEGNAMIAIQEYRKNLRKDMKKMKSSVKDMKKEKKMMNEYEKKVTKYHTREMLKQLLDKYLKIRRLNIMKKKRRE